MTVTFTPVDGGTLVELVHDEFERHGEGGSAVADGVRGGWSGTLDRFAAAADADRPHKHVMSYRAAEGFLPLAQEHGPAHVARLREFHARGVLLMVGTLQEPFDGSALGVFTTREAAEEFIAGDPFVLNGVVASWTVRAWDEVLVP